ncbi:MAG: diaminopimelate epimerase [Actinomycetota bacterium]|nr:diaminopimelate epimerase [Actinomycetota bacterium]
MPALTLTKHHGLGNDFLVLLDLAERTPLDADLARSLCDRRRGIGADGIMRVTPGDTDADVAMQLRNADGSEAELSGNGLRCLAQAVVDAGVVPGPEVRVRTRAGVRRVVVLAEEAPGLVTASVEMGDAKVGPDQPQDFPERKARTVDMGNPHLVLLGPDPAGLDVPGLGARIEAVHAGGINVEFVAVGPGPDTITMRVWERGVGETQACGSGACAAAAAAREWGLVGSRVTVRQPGGEAVVELSDDGVVLVGPSQRIATIEVDLP